MKIDTNTKLTSTYPVLDFTGVVVEITETQVVINAYVGSIRVLGGTGQVRLEILLGEQTTQTWEILKGCFPPDMEVTGSACFANGKLYLSTLESA